MSALRTFDVDSAVGIKIVEMTAACQTEDAIVAALAVGLALRVCAPRS